jgi:hypothetical protein
MRSQSHIKFAKVSPFVPCVYSHNVVQVRGNPFIGTCFGFCFDMVVLIWFEKKPLTSEQSARI